MATSLDQLVASTSPGWFTHQLSFRGKDSTISGWITFISNAEGIKAQLDWDDPNWKGIAFNISLPAGTYEFYRFQFGDQSHGIFPPSSQPISLTFEVKGDEVLYVGEIKCYFNVVKRVPGTPPYGFMEQFQAKDPYFVFSNKSERDIAVLRGKFPDLDKYPVRVDLPPADSAGSPYIRSTPR